jgi:hypothetical protein
VQGVIVGATLAFLTTVLILNAVAKERTNVVNGWKEIREAGRPSNGVLVRAALQKALPVVNVFEEAAYWTTDVDGSGRRLSGGRAYSLHFPPGQLPPNRAFWSLTATDTTGYMVSNPAGRSSVDSHTSLVMNADGSADILLRAQVLPDRHDNWLPVPSGRFKLTLRAYLPGEAITNGSYRLPPVIEARS